MRNIAKIAAEDRAALFHNTAEAMKMTDAIIEKDFWVCYMLDYLFHRLEWKDHIALKVEQVFQRHTDLLSASQKILI